MSDEGFNEEIHVPTRTGDLVSAGNYLTIGDKQFTLDTVDHISYWWTNRRTNGVYTGHFFSIKRLNDHAVVERTEFDFGHVFVP